MNFFSKATEGKNIWYLYVIGFLLTLLGYFMGQIPLTLVAKKYSDKITDNVNALYDALSSNDFASLGMSNNLTFFLLILMFVFGTLGLWFSVKYLHNKRFIHLITPSGKFDLNRFFFGFGIWLIIGIFFEVVTYLIHPTELTFQFDAVKFFILLLICVFLLPVQTSFEELFVRGYLMQGLSLIFKNKVLLMFLTSFLFASLHLMNPEIEKYGIGIMLTYYVLAGVVLALFTIMDGRLELALGIHFATNFYGATVASYDGSVLQTDAIFKQGEINPYLMVLSLVFLSVVFYAFASKIYGWKKLSSILEPVEHENEDSIDSNGHNESL
jgi:membrane protease YdiL (CAAX protease family)